MTFTPRGAAVVIALALLATVASQLFYIGVVSPSDSAILRKITWTVEMALFTLVAVAALSLTARSSMPMVWAAVALSGIVNVIQVGMGLLEFPQAREAADEQVFQTVLNGAFFLYFHGKLLVGVAAIALGITALRQAGVFAKALGGFSVVAGIAAAAFNLHGMANGMELVFQAGAAGTAATALVALTILFAVKDA